MGDPPKTKKLFLADLSTSFRIQADQDLVGSSKCEMAADPGPRRHQGARRIEEIRRSGRIKRRAADENKDHNIILTFIY